MFLLVEGIHGAAALGILYTSIDVGTAFARKRSLLDAHQEEQAAGHKDKKKKECPGGPKHASLKEPDAPPPTGPNIGLPRKGGRGKCKKDA
eukprot:1160421-Pelagomonas_calceolata.AAC.8